ncbi:MAG: glycine oxidase [Thermoleophilaceae bacterium]|nr:glycine oxidase [Thermoleophilaceae bacterium]
MPIGGTPERDVVVVGAGIVGLACAWRAVQEGLSVLVLDRGAPGASEAAAGMLAPVTEAEFGEERLLALNLEGAAAWPAFAAELQERTGVDLGYRDSGALAVAVDRDDAEELRRLHALQRSLGLDAEWVSGRECRGLEPGLSPRVRGGVLAPQDRSVDPRAVLRALRIALDGQGVEVASGVEVTGVEQAADSLTGLTTGDGRVPARRVVMAAGAWSGSFGPWAPPVRPVKGQILRLRGPARPLLADRVVRTPRCYVVSRASGEIVIGATMEERGFDTTVTAGAVHRLLEAAWEVLPDIEERELREASAALRPGTPDNCPAIGAAGPDGLLWATGHHRNGVLLAPITADAVAAMLVERAVPAAIEPFSPARFEGQPGLTGSRA